MAKQPTGSRPTPRVASPKKPTSWNTGDGSYNATSGTKAPTGSRPVPKVANNKAPAAAKPGAVKKSIKQTSMPHNRPSGDKTRGSGNM